LSKTNAAGKPGKPHRRLRVLLGMVLLCVLAAVAAVADIVHELHKPLPLNQPVVVEIRQGERLRVALARFVEQGVIDPRQRLYLMLHLRINGGAKSIRAGEYEVEPVSTALDLLRLLGSGHVLLREVRFTEGWTFAQALAALRESPYIAHTLPENDAAVSAAMAAVGAPGLPPEGHFFPDTYRFAKGTDDIVILRQAYESMHKRLADAWNSRTSAASYQSPDEALILASLVEKETAVDTERPQIAGVFLRRLHLGMKLQADPTVIYGLGARYDGKLHSRDLITDTPYNTYMRTGLPPTPICLPGEASLQAVMHPAEGDALYFVARGDGTHQFSATLDAHNAAVRRYQLGGRHGE
jgi:UPF0755 protein